jgi:ubiquinone/menaquinone biosynthesis C-methylase UbiE
MSKRENAVESSRTHYDKNDENFERSIEGLFSSVFKKEIVKSVNLFPNMVLLDVGCANGKLLKMFYEENGEIHGVGIDVSPKMIEVAKANVPQANFVVGDATHLPFQENSFDMITCSASFHHFPSPETFMKEALRVLKPGGKLLIAEIHAPTRIGKGAFNFYIEHFNTEGDVRVYSPKELDMFYKNAGFVTIEKVKYRYQVQIHLASKPKKI